MMGASSILPLRLVELSFDAGGRAIIDRVSLELAAGTRTVILGANGAGKSVLMRLMHGLLPPSSGRIEWSESDAKRVRARQAMVFQRPVMLRRSALANVAYGLEIAGVPRPERERRAWECLERVGLSHLAGRAARVLSGGEQQRLALARAWALRPQVLFPIVAFLMLVVVLGYQVFRPFLLDLVVSSAVALLLSPLQRRLAGALRGRASIASGLLVLMTAVLILAPILFPVAAKLGIDPVHFGIIMVVNMEIGMLTPPVGLNLYVASGLTKLGLTETSISVLPWLATMLGFLVLVTYWPDLSLWLPRTLGML